MDGQLDAALISILLAAALVILALAAWLIAAVGLVLSYKRGGARHRWRRRFIVIFTVASVILLVAVANALWSAWTAPGSQEDQARAAAVAKVRAQFANPDAVQIERLWIGRHKPFELAVCGVAHSDELTNPSAFIFSTNFTAPPMQFDKPEKGRAGDWVDLQLPPSINGAGPKDVAYWEKVTTNANRFSWRWTDLCAKTEPGSNKGEVD